MAPNNDREPDIDAEAGQAGGVQSVDRALAVLEILARIGQTGVTDIAEEMGIHKSTASRLLGSLVSREMVHQNSDRGKYELGFRHPAAGQLHLRRCGGVWPPTEKNSAPPPQPAQQ